MLLSLVSSTAAFSQSIKETINQHILNGSYDRIEGIWEGTMEISIYFEKELIKQLDPQNIRVSFYNEYSTIKGSASDLPKDKVIELTKGATPGSFSSRSTQKGFQYIRGAGKQTDEYSMTIIEEHQQVDPNGILISGIIEYKLRKTYPLNNDFTILKEREIRRRQEEIEKAPRSGTGFAISPDGLIVTNFHVVEKANSITVRMFNGESNQKYRVEVIQEDRINDLAILQIKDERFKPFTTIPFRIKSTSSDVGEDVFVLGYPLTATMGDEVKLTTGIISSKTGFQGNVSQYQISAPIQPGNSGGPLFDKAGNIIGIVSSKHLETENVGYAVKSSYLQSIIEILPQKISNTTTTSISGKSLPEKVKVLRNYVFLVEVNNE